jgi:hypothetical protein
MPKEAFGGDDDEEAPKEEKKTKLDLSRYSKGQDENVRNLFWEIVEAYDSRKQPDLSDFGNDMFALIRAAIGAIGRPSPIHEHITATKAANKHDIMDNGWMLSGTARRVPAQERGILCHLRSDKEAHGRRQVC